MIRLALDSPTHSLEDGAIKCLPIILPILDFSTVKNEVFPPIASTFSRTNSLAIKIRGLEAFAVLCGGTVDDGSSKNEVDDLAGLVPGKRTQSGKGRANNKSSILDKYTIQEKLVPTLKGIKTKEPAVMMAALNVFREVGKIADSEFLALEVLPILWSFSMGPLLNVNQFREFMNLIKSLSAKIEQEQTRKLQELSSSVDSSGNDGDGFEESSQFGDGLLSNGDSVRNDFERLVLGKKPTTTKASSREIDNGLDSFGGTEPTVAKPSSSKKELSSTEALSFLNTGPSTVGRLSSPQVNPNFRSVTPDYNMSSFPALEPAPKQQESPWSGLQLSSSSIWDGPNIPPPPMTSNTFSTAAQPTGNYSAFSIPPPPPSGASGFSSTASTTTNTTSSQPLQNTQKQGLDKYESLL